MAEPLRIMIVDDEPLAIERLQLLLARIEGVALAGTASDGAAALRLVEAVGPDSESCTSFGMPIRIGVSKMPGAMVQTRICRLARSRAAQMVIPITPALEVA